jgi:hypothetical protein
LIEVTEGRRRRPRQIRRRINEIASRYAIKQIAIDRLLTPTSSPTT